MRGVLAPLVLIARLAAAQSDGGTAPAPTTTTALTGRTLEAMPGVLGDPLRAAGTFAGSRELLSGLSPLGFDGLQPATTAITFDGVPLRVPAHVYFGPWSLPAALVGSLELSPGVASTRTGRTLGRELTVTPPGLEDALHAQARLDLFALGGAVSAPAGPARVQLAGRLFTGPLLATRFVSGLQATAFDYQGRVELGRLRILLLGADDVAGITSGGLPVATHVGDHSLDVRWRTDAAEVGLTLGLSRAGLSTSGALTAATLDATELHARARAAATLDLTDTTHVTLGSDLELRRPRISERWTMHPPTVDGQPLDPIVTTAELTGLAAVGGAYAEVRLESEAPWVWTLGLRADLWQPPGAASFFTVDPRLALERPFGTKVTARLAAGLQHQAPTWLVPVPVLDTYGLNAGTQEAVRTELTVDVRPCACQVISARVFALALTRAIELSPFDPDILQIVKGAEGAIAARASTGWAAGAELSWRLVETERWGALASYSFQQSWRTLPIARYDDYGVQRGTGIATVPATFMQAHAVNVVGQWFPGRGWSVSAAATFHTGAPQSGQLYSGTQREGLDPFVAGPKWVQADRDAAPFSQPWLRVDARVAKRFHPGKLELDLFLDVQNLSVWKQPTGTRYVTSGTTLLRETASSPLPGPLPMLGLTARY